MVQIGQSTHGENIPQFAKAPHVLILEARFYNDINDHLIVGATEILEKAGATWEIRTVPGALEIPVALKFASQRKNDKPFDAYIVLGCVIRGGTTHYEIVSEESNRGVMKMSMKYDLALGNGILTVENVAQALERADKAGQNKGGGAAMAALTMLKLKQSFGLAE
ncbi:MAG TPA: 6,7-dimethyl-8-ribityllumazine synthase [Alphaproteobacteria bacterium]|nr:6,7-dimethyl-8-ribityllumazine synthase [Alphaproteobacteria bacterium]HNS45362.1 6,7-dimethyl-8-ribityllumazine synthase [Alphaproteobacteria bacterium]